MAKAKTLMNPCIRSLLRFTACRSPLGTASQEERHLPLGYLAPTQNPLAVAFRYINPSPQVICFRRSVGTVIVARRGAVVLLSACDAVASFGLKFWRRRGFWHHLRNR